MYALNTFSPLLISAFNITMLIAISASVAIAFFGALKTRLYSTTLSNEEVKQWHLSNLGKLSQHRHHKTFTATRRKSSARNCRALIARHSKQAPSSVTIYCNLNHILQLTQAENAKQASQSPYPSLGMSSTPLSISVPPCNLPQTWQHKFQSQTEITSTPLRARQMAANLTQARYATLSTTLAVYMTRTDRTEQQPYVFSLDKPTAQTRDRAYHTPIQSSLPYYGNAALCRPIAQSPCDFSTKTANCKETPTPLGTLPNCENCKPQAMTPIIFAPLLTVSAMKTENEQWTKSELSTSAMRARKASTARRLATIQRRAEVNRARRLNERRHYHNRLNHLATMDSELNDLLNLLR